MKRFLSSFIAFMLIFALMSTPVMAADMEVKLPTAKSGVTIVSGLWIDGVDIPKAGKKLDTSAVVHTKEGYKWEIAVVWLGKDGKVANVAKDGESYYPTLAFYVPPRFGLSSDSFKVSLSDSLSKLLGDRNLVSAFDASTGITFILPPSVANISFAEGNPETASVTGLINAERTSRWSSQASSSLVAESSASTSSSQTSGSEAESEPSPAPAPASKKSFVELYCADTAINRINNADLEKVANLIVNTLQPQAVNLLLESFPAFKEGAAKGEIGKDLGLYIYYMNGDKDGLLEHETAFPDMAFVMSSANQFDGELKYSYFLGVNIAYFVETDKDYKAIIDKDTGKMSLCFEGEQYKNLNNTMIHEMLHAFMSDYNRTGESGASKLEELILDENLEPIHPDAVIIDRVLHYPWWFIEGLASSVENNYELRVDDFRVLRAKKDSGYEDSYTSQGVLYNYLYGKYWNGENGYFDLKYIDITKEAYEADPNINNINTRYVSGYLATLFLADLAYQYQNELEDHTYEINAKSSERLREGMNYMLEELHNGSTLDQLISEISPIVDGKRLYSSTDEFANEFIKGLPSTADSGEYESDAESLTFVTNYLNYMLALEKDTTRKNKPNGSILFDLDVDIDLPLDPDKVTSSDYFRIDGSNRMVPSTVSPDIAMIGGGKSELNSDGTESLHSQVFLAAKENSVGAKIGADDKGEECSTESSLDDLAVTSEEVTKETDSEKDAENAEEAEVDKPAVLSEEETADAAPNTVAEEPSEVTAEKAADECKESAAENSADECKESAAENSADENKESAAENPADTSEESATESEVDKPAVPSEEVAKEKAPETDAEESMRVAPKTATESFENSTAEPIETTGISSPETSTEMLSEPPSETSAESPSSDDAIPEDTENE